MPIKKFKTDAEIIESDKKWELANLGNVPKTSYEEDDDMELIIKNKRKILKKYKEIMNNPKLSKKAKDKLKKQTKNGSNTTIEDLEAFEKIELAMDEDWDEDKPKKTNKDRQVKDNTDKEKQKDLDRLKQFIIRTDPIDYENYGNAQMLEYDKKYDEAKKIYYKLYKKSLKDPYYKSTINGYYDEEDKPKEDKKTKQSNKYRPEKDNKEIMKASSRIKKVGDKHNIETELKVHKKLKDKSDQNKLLQSVENALKKEFKQINGGYLIDFEGGMINDDVIKPKPLIKNQGEYDRLNNYVENIMNDDYTVERTFDDFKTKKPDNIDIVEVFNLEHIDDMTTKDLMIKYNLINRTLLDITNDWLGDYYRPYSKLPADEKNDYINKKDYENKSKQKILTTLKSNKDMLYDLINIKEGKGISDKKIKSKMLKHLTEHIADYDEPIDPKDYKQAKELIDNIRNDKKKRGRPKKEQIVKVEVIKKLPYQKFSHAKNSSLEQLLQAKAEKEDKELKSLNKDVLTKQKEIMKLLGF